MRFRLVPKVMSDQTFWNIYFVLIKRKVGEYLYSWSQLHSIHRLRNHYSYARSKHDVIAYMVERLEKHEVVWSSIVSAVNRIDTAMAHGRNGAEMNDDHDYSHEKVEETLDDVIRQVKTTRVVDLFKAPVYRVVLYYQPPSRESILPLSATEIIQEEEQEISIFRHSR